MVEECKCTMVETIKQLKDEISDLKVYNKENAKETNIKDKDINRTEIYVEQIFGILKDLKDTLAENLKKSIATENLALNLKTVTDELTKGLKEVTEKVTTIEEKPAKDAERLKWLIIGFFVINIVGIIKVFIK